MKAKLVRESLNEQHPADDLDYDEWEEEVKEEISIQFGIEEELIKAIVEWGETQEFLRRTYDGEEYPTVAAEVLFDQTFIHDYLRNIHNVTLDEITDIEIYESTGVKESLNTSNNILKLGRAELTRTKTLLDSKTLVPG